MDRNFKRSLQLVLNARAHGPTIRKTRVARQ
jgi:hypothetical protein